MLVYRPISLVNGFYKILFKVLVNCLVHWYGENLILKPQNASVKGIQMIDLFLITNKVFDRRLKSWEPGLLCKLDMKKVNDHVNWKIFILFTCKMWLWREIAELDRILHLSNPIFYLGEWFTGGILRLLSWLEIGASILSLFVLFVMEALNMMIADLVEGGFLYGF